MGGIAVALTGGVDRTFGAEQEGKGRRRRASGEREERVEEEHSLLCAQNGNRGGRGSGGRLLL